MRLRRGEMDAATVYGDDPAAQARRFEEDGFEFLHIVDLNGAFAGSSVNGPAVEAILSAVHSQRAAWRRDSRHGGDRDMAEPGRDPGYSRHCGGARSRSCQRSMPGVSGPRRCGHRRARRPGGGRRMGRDQCVERGRSRAAFANTAASRPSSTPTSRRDGMLEGLNLEATRELAVAVDIPVHRLWRAGRHARRYRAASAPGKRAARRGDRGPGAL